MKQTMFDKPGREFLPGFCCHGMTAEDPQYLNWGIAFS
jgi:hypothetical protein